LVTADLVFYHLSLNDRTKIIDHPAVLHRSLEESYVSFYGEKQTVLDEDYLLIANRKISNY
jgi:hypothetical protein